MLFSLLLGVLSAADGAGKEAAAGKSASAAAAAGASAFGGDGDEVIPTFKSRASGTDWGKVIADQKDKMSETMDKIDEIQHKWDRDVGSFDVHDDDEDIDRNLQKQAINLGIAPVPPDSGLPESLLETRRAAPPSSFLQSGYNAIKTSIEEKIEKARKAFDAKMKTTHEKGSKRIAADLEKLKNQHENVEKDYEQTMKVLGVKTGGASTPSPKAAPSSLLQFDDDGDDQTAFLRDDERKAEEGFRALLHTKKVLEKDRSRLRIDREDRQVRERKRHDEEAKRKLAYEQRAHARDLKLQQLRKKYHMPEPKADAAGSQDDAAGSQ